MHLRLCVCNHRVTSGRRSLFANTRSFTHASKHRLTTNIQDSAPRLRCKNQKQLARRGKNSASLTWMRHLLTSLAQRALLQPEVRDNIERRKRRTATAGRISSPGLILTAHQQGTGKSPTSMRDTAQDLRSGMED